MLLDNERDLAVPAQFALRLKTPVRGSFEGKRTGLTCRPQVDRLQKEPITAVTSV